MEQPQTDKFFLLQAIEDYLAGTGMGAALTNVITLLVAAVLLALLFWLLDYLGTRVILAVIRKAVKRTETLWDDYLLHRKFFPRLIEFVTAGFLLAMVRVFFRGFSQELIDGVAVLLRIYMVVVGGLLSGAILNTINDIYDAKPQARRKSIRGYIQTGKIVIYGICGILIISILIRRDPTDLLLGLGASAALLSLVFKDTILGFVASIQLSAQDMLRPGDWIEMPAKGADGVVSEINVNSVKVQNWDNTMTMIPIYSLVSESFTNWRNMEESGGRRFKRPLLFDLTSVAILSQEQLDRLAADPLIADVAPAMLDLHGKTNTSSFTTNLGLFRCYVHAYLRQHPKTVHTLPLVVRYLPADENGIAMQIYGFSAEKSFPVFEQVVADLLNHIIAVVPFFSLRLYQRPTAGVAAVADTDPSGARPA